MELGRMRTGRKTAARAAFIGVIVLATAPATMQSREVGIMLLAHGGSRSWNATVDDLRARVDERVPAEVAFGMATRATIQAAILTWRASRRTR
jgi:hypothetical protein